MKHFRNKDFTLRLMFELQNVFCLQKNQNEKKNPKLFFIRFYFKSKLKYKLMRTYFTIKIQKRTLF